MAEGHSITVAPSDSHVEVRLAGQLLASTDRALRLDETGLPPRYYVPRADVRMDLLRPSDHQTTCPFKGDASYWSAEIDGTEHANVVWAYEAPIEAVAEIADHLCFYPTRTEVTVDGERLTT